MSESPPVAILGVPFDSLGLEAALERIEQMLKSGRPHYLATANVDFLVQARTDLELHRILLDADLVLCDGTPVLWASRLLGNRLPERVAGADLVPRLIERAAEKRYRLFFLGGEPKVTAKAVAGIKQKFPAVQIVGSYAPPFRPLLQMDHGEIARRIKAAAPDIVFVSFGCPKAEKWMAMHYRTLGVPVMIGVGGTIDFLAGEKRRAPKWMRRSGTEWMFRLMQEPRRLVRRYMKDLWRFFPAVAYQAVQLRRGSHRASILPHCCVVVNEPTWARLRLPPRLTREVILRDRELLESLQEQHCLLELANVEFIDSTALAALVRLHRALRKNGCHLLLLEPSLQVWRALTCLRLDKFFLIARDVVHARELIQEGEPDAVLHWQASTPPSLLCRGELTARNAQSLWEHLQTALTAPVHRTGALTIDCSGVRFLDSAALAVLVRARQQAERLGLGLRLVGLPAHLLELIRLAQLDQVLLDAPP